MKRRETWVHGGVNPEDNLNKVSLEDWEGIETTDELRILIRDWVRHDIAPIAEVMEKTEPEIWWTLVIRKLIRLRDSLDKYPTKVKKYLVERYNLFVDYVLGEIDIEQDEEKRREQIIQRAEMVIMSFSAEIADDFWVEKEPIETNFISLQELVNQYPQHFSLRKAKVRKAKDGSNKSWEEVESTQDGTSPADQDIYDFYFLGIHHPESGKIKELPIPIGENIAHKGGPSRLILNLIQGAPQEMINADFDWNDLDIIAWGKDKPRIRRVAETMAVDPAGVETFEQKKLDWSWYFYGRDTTQNQAAVSDDGIYFADAAAETARTGKASTVGLYVPNKAIYGEDVALFEGYLFAKARGLMRLVKAVAEKKLISFEYLPANEEIDFGVYWLFLARKWSKRNNFGELMQRMYQLGVTMGQVREGEESIYEVLDRVHTEFPFFRLDQEIENVLDVVRWKSRKLAKQLDRETRWKFQVPTELKIEPTEENITPVQIDLQGFIPDPELSKVIEYEWEPFLERCRERTRNYYATERDYVSDLFFHSDVKAGRADIFDLV